MTREEVFRICCKARTRAEVQQAWKARSAYLQERPEDHEMVDIGAMLSMREEALEFLRHDHQEAPFPVLKEREPMQV